MSPTELPVVSIGLPVYNGEKFVGQAIESVLAQSYTNLELIVCDDASTDATASIVKRYAEHDLRARYFLSPMRLGIARNFNATLERARGRYFKWLAADDFCLPAFVERCVRALETNPAAVLAYARALAIDGTGGMLHDYSWIPTGGHDAPDAVARFRRLTREFADDGWSKQLADGSRIGGGTAPIYLHGLMRTEVLRSVRRMGGHSGADQNLLVDLVLRGPFAEVPERLKRIRLHDGASSHQLVNWNPEAWQRHLDPSVRNRRSLYISLHRKHQEYLRSALAAQLPWRSRTALLGAVARPTLERAQLRLRRLRQI